MRVLCAIIALAAGALSVLYLLGIFQTGICLSVILGLGILLHAALAALLFLRHWNFLAGVTVLMAVFYLAALVYFNI